MQPLFFLLVEIISKTRVLWYRSYGGHTWDMRGFLFIVRVFARKDYCSLKSDVQTGERLW